MMVDKRFIDFAEEIKSYINENGEVKEENNKIIINAKLDTGIKGMNFNIECSQKAIKIKGSMEYPYPVSESAVETFQQEMQKHKGYSIYVNRQTLFFSKFLIYQNMEDAKKEIKDALSLASSVILAFENSCVNFTEQCNEEGISEEEYNPENIEMLNVDNSFHAVPMTEQDNQSYTTNHQEYTEKVFAELSQKIGNRTGNEAIQTNEDGSTVKVILFPADAEIAIMTSVNVPQDVGAMYIAYINANYPELLCAYDTEKEQFVIRAYSTPDPYAPDETEELFELSQKALTACKQEYQQTLSKKDSTDFALDVQKLLEKQTEAVTEREKSVTAREEEIAAREEKFKQEKEKMEEEKKQLLSDIEQERKRMQEREQEMKETIQKYEERSTKDILSIKQLANQVASLQNKQKVIGTTDEKTEEEIFRLKTKIQQLTNQKIALEKNLTEKLTNKDSKIMQLTNTISEKDNEINKIKDNVEDMVQSKMADETQKYESHMKQLEEQLKAVGHILTPDEMVAYLKSFSDIEAQKRHAPNAEFVVYTDGALEIRIRFGAMNYVDVTRDAALKDSILRKLNTKYSDYKFFSKDNKITGRGYFSKTSTAAEVDVLIETLAANFSK